MFLEQQISILEGFEDGSLTHDTENWSNDAENSTQEYIAF